ncbi:hypothetical protein CLIB1423_21S00650 [[Candida] railenensis]|uniref:Uncharacterized protein n=1 Tax=[Candida] railenensis TaxID=45579 RepID=A0A9P0QU30_9ASCO|nr:hypothetical protein CLIB1423_21S00650 [[Candida] railenensis]
MISRFRKYIIVFYTTSVLVGSTLDQFVTQYQSAISSNKLEAFLNRLLVSPFGYFLFTLIFLGNALTNLNQYKLVKKFVLYYFSYTISSCILVMWFFGPSLFDIVNRLTGGYCKISTSQFKCMQDKDSWVNGFDTSGHVFMLVGMSVSLLILLEACKCSNKPVYQSLEEQIPAEELEVPAPSSSPSPSRFASLYIIPNSDFLDLITYLFLFFWYVVLMVTALFFHTFVEKCFGLLFGMTLPLTIEYVIDKKRSATAET